ncbi:hypothetical protein FKP32DRAFT_1553814, partial [Trametes sanguinea]
AWYVTLGKGRSRKTRTKPFCPGGKFSNPFPIVFKVPSEELADEILTYREAIKAVEAAENVYDRVRLIYTLPLGDDILKDYIETSVGQGLYPVCWGHECAVFSKVDDARDATKGIEKAIWRKVPSFRRAVAFMVSGGESEKKGNVELRQLLMECLASGPRVEAPAEEDEPSVFPMPVTPRHPSRAQAAPAATPSAPRAQATPAVTPSGSPHKRAMNARPTSQLPSSAEASSSSSTLLSDLMFDLSVADLNLEGEWVYQHTRNLRGIKASHNFPVVSSTRVPSCGRALDMFLQAFGSDIDSKLLVAYACKHSNTMEEFVRQLTVLTEPPTFVSTRANPLSIALSYASYFDMVLYGKGRRMAARREAASAQRKYVTRLARKPYRTRRKAITITKTPAEKKLISQQRAERREKMAEALAAARETVAEEARKMQAEFGLHSDKYFEQQIFQHARVTSTKRKTNPWNAFLRHELQKRNDALPAGAPRYSSSDKTVISEISAKWKAMSDEEKASVSEDLVKDLDEQKEMKALAVQSVPISAFHDVRATLESVFEELRRLHARTGIEIGLFAVRSGRHQFTPPMVFATSSHVHDFFQISLGTPMDDVACSLEAYCLSGVSGLVQRSVDVIQDLRSRLTAVINQKLGKATQYTAKKMLYVGFAEHITARHGVVIENWPLPRFLAPSAIRTRLELTTLLSAWETDTARFRKLSREEWQAWQGQEAGNTSNAI